jgi:hypothetical protein
VYSRTHTKSSDRDHFLLALLELVSRFFRHFLRLVLLSFRCVLLLASLDMNPTDGGL